jgi:hypothetical protein
MSRALWLRSFVSVLSITVVPALAGCRRPPPHLTSDATPPPSADDGACPVDPTDPFCNVYADALCRAQQGCCEDPTLLDASLDECVVQTRCECAAYRRGAAFAGGAVSFDAAAGSALVARLRAEATTCDALAPGEIDYVAATRGSLHAGDDCTPTDDDYSLLFACGPGLYCQVVDGSTDDDPAQGTCTIAVTVGSTCDGDDVCETGAHCAAAATPGDPDTCVRDAAVGAPCTEDSDCASAICDGVTSTCDPSDPDDTWCGGGALDEE